MWQKQACLSICQIKRCKNVFISINCSDRDLFIDGIVTMLCAQCHNGHYALSTHKPTKLGLFSGWFDLILRFFLFCSCRWPKLASYTPLQRPVQMSPCVSSASKSWRAGSQKMTQCKIQISFTLPVFQWFELWIEQITKMVYSYISLYILICARLLSGLNFLIKCPHRLHLCRYFKPAHSVINTVSYNIYPLTLLSRQEHKSHSSSCAFITLKKKVEELTVEEFFKLHKEQCKYVVVSIPGMISADWNENASMKRFPTPFFWYWLSFSDISR